MDRFGVFLCAGLIGAVVFMWWIGWAGLGALLVALLVTAAFLLIVIWIGNQSDDDETNNSLGSAFAEARGEASAAWEKARQAVQGNPKP
jgi:hypothetical protein